MKKTNLNVSVEAPDDVTDETIMSTISRYLGEGQSADASRPEPDERTVLACELAIDLAFADAPVAQGPFFVLTHQAVKFPGHSVPVDTGKKSPKFVVRESWHANGPFRRRTTAELVAKVVFQSGACLSARICTAKELQVIKDRELDKRAKAAIDTALLLVNLQEADSPEAESRPELGMKLVASPDGTLSIHQRPDPSYAANNAPNQAAIEYWRRHYYSGGLCHLCGGVGIIDVRETAISPTGMPVGGLSWCICATGQDLRQSSGGLNPTEEDLRQQRFGDADGN